MRINERDGGCRWQTERGFRSWRLSVSVRVDVVRAAMLVLLVLLFVPVFTIVVVVLALLVGLLRIAAVTAAVTITTRVTGGGNKPS